MTEPTQRTSTFTEQINERGAQLADRIRELVKEGNVRKIIVRRHGHTVVEFPLTVGVIGTLLAPQLAALGAIVALLTECTIEVVRTQQTPPTSA